MLKNAIAAILALATLIAVDVLTPDVPDVSGQKAEFSQMLQHRQEMHRLGLDENF